MFETLHLSSYPYGGKKETAVIRVEYKRCAYYTHDPEYVPEHKGKKQSAYAIKVDGVLVGTIRQVVVSTSRSPVTSRIRWGIGSHLEWAWDTTPGKPNRHGRTSNAAGVYGTTRREAVAALLGYDSAEKADR